MSEAVTRIARILRADKDDIIKIDTHLSAVTGKEAVLERIVSENDALITDRLEKLNLTRGASSGEVYNALTAKIESDDRQLREALGCPKMGNPADCQKVFDTITSLVATNHGFFLKPEKAAEFLHREPPQQILDYLEYDSVDSMLAHEDLFEVYSSLRFLENSDWMNDVFFKQYETLTPDDFEERALRTIALDERWRNAAERFVKKKWHNISHLKELGIVFVTPVMLGISGEFLRMVSLILHYLYEVPFYARLFKQSAEDPQLFSEQVISLLRGDVIDRRMSQGDKTLWLVIQRYLAKDDEHDWRLVVPHINPEAFHWARAEESLAKIGDTLDGFGEDLRFWHNLDWVGDYFKNEAGNDILVSFDLVDTVMSLVKQKELIKYLYHHQEALWNKLFAEYMGREQLEQYFYRYLLQGYFEV